MTLLFVYVGLALGASFLCSVLEAVLLSVTPSFVIGMQRSAPASGERLARLKRDIDRPLAAILSLNTVAHTVGAAGAGAQAMEVFGEGSVAIASAILTLLILVFSEIIPKTIGARFWKRLAVPTARLCEILIVLMSPLVLISRLLAKVLRGTHNGPTVSRAEFRALAEVVHREGVVDETESRILHNLLRFRTIEGNDIMTPRNVLSAFPETATVAEAIAQEEKLRFSRLPIYSESIDHIDGYILKHDLMLAFAHGETDKQLAALKRNMVMRSDSSSLPELLDTMLHAKEHIVLLTDEHGGTAGVATLEDVVETLLGLEIVDETDPTEDMRLLARKRWEERARRLGVVLDDAAFEDEESEPPKNAD